MSVQGRPDGRSLRAASIHRESSSRQWSSTGRLSAITFCRTISASWASFPQRPVSYFPRWFVAPWTEDIWGYVPDEIRPFPALSYVVMAWFGAASPEPNHIVNIALHAVNGLLVMGIAEAAAGLALAAGHVCRPRVRAAADTGGERCVGHRPCRFAADLLLFRLVSAVCAVDPPEGGRHRRLIARCRPVEKVLPGDRSRCSSPRSSANRTRSRWRPHSCSSTGSSAADESRSHGGGSGPMCRT